LGWQSNVDTSTVRQLIDQIAAGEVIRKAGVSRQELIENAFDAGARQIDVDVERAGLGLIAVRDDGCGLGAFGPGPGRRTARNQQIASVDRPGGNCSFGFRGEALPSIGSVARMRLVSCLRGEGQRMS